MVTVLLVLSMATQVSPERHVRTTEPRIQALIDEGLDQSATFRQLITTLNESDVIAYVEPQLTRQALGGFLFHNIAGEGGWRYVRIAIDHHGSRIRVVALLAHELQHAIEIAQDPGVRDADSLKRSFSQRAVIFGCGGECYETKAAKEIEQTVLSELKHAHGVPTRRPN